MRVGLAPLECHSNPSRGYGLSVSKKPNDLRVTSIECLAYVGPRITPSVHNACTPKLLVRTLSPHPKNNCRESILVAGWAGLPDMSAIGYSIADEAGFCV